MRATLSPPTIQSLPPSAWRITTVRASHPTASIHPDNNSNNNHNRIHRRREHYQNNAAKYWDRFYTRHQHKFFKDRHYLEKDWGSFFAGDDEVSSNRKIVLEVGCGTGNALFPLLTAFPNLYVHACDLSPRAVSLVKSNESFREDRVNAFVSDVAHEALCHKISPSSVDVVTMVFMLSAVSPSKMPLILHNIKTVLKPNGHVLVRDYAVGDYAQVKLQNKDRMLGEDFYVRGDGTCSFFFSEDFLSALFLGAGFKAVDMSTYCRLIHNRSRNVAMDRRWIRAVFRSDEVFA